MLPAKLRRCSALIAGLMIAALPAQTQACWLFNCFGHHSRTTFFAPAAVAAPACNTCAQQTVSFVPQTAFRPLVTTTPVTALRPVTSIDPCTGCPTTVMQPTTAFVQRTVMMPHTTFRPVMRTSFFAPAVAAPVFAAPACPTGACAPAATTTFFQPATIAPAVTQPGCCATNATPTTFGSTSSITTAPLISNATPVYGSPVTPGPRTFNNASESPSDKTESQKAIPEANQNGGNGEATSLPRLTDPLNRTTSTQASTYTPVAWKVARPIAAANTAKLDRTAKLDGTAKPDRTVKLDDSGWEAAR